MPSRNPLRGLRLVLGPQAGERLLEQLAQLRDEQPGRHEEERTEPDVAQQVLG